MGQSTLSGGEDSRIIRWLHKIADFGNKLPEPTTLFFIIAGLVIVASAIFAGIQIEGVMQPTDDGYEEGTVVVQSLLSAEGIQWMYLNSVDNFVNFAPLGPVLMVMLGIGIAERTGLITTGLKMMVMSVPDNWVTATLIFACVMSSIAADAGYVVMIPLGGMLFAGLGRHPLAGIAAAFAGVSAGFSANLSLTGLDPMLAEITNEAAKIQDPEYTVMVTANYYFLVVSTFLVTIVGTLVTNKIIEPMLGDWDPSQASEPIEEPEEPTKLERRNFWIAMSVAGLVVGFIAFLGVWDDSPLRKLSGDPESTLDALEPYFARFDVLLTLLFFLPGLIYGILDGSITGDDDAVEMANETMSSMGAYVVLAFPAGQFIAYFGWSNLDIAVADAGIQLLNTIGAQGIPLLIAFIFVAGLINMVIGSASAKWAVMGPVFVPMLMGMGLSPELVQAGYRVGDSVTNIITPLMSYLPIIIVFARKYIKDIQIGTLLTVMLPYSVALGIAWTIMLILWLLLGVPIGPGAEAFV